MRTTLTIDDDVAAALERLRKRRDTSFKEVVNDVLRRGLHEVTAPAKQRELYRTHVAHLGPSKVGSLDKISEVLALVDGDDYK
jgi:Ribbon-helix-helix protein, copG family